MAKRKRIKSRKKRTTRRSPSVVVVKTASTPTRRKRRKSRKSITRSVRFASRRRKKYSRSLIKGLPSGTVESVKTAALTGVGAIGGSLVASKLPVPENIKTFIPAALGIGLLMMAKGNKMVVPISTGAILASLLSVAKKVSPNMSIAGNNVGLPMVVKNNLGISSDISNINNPIEELLLVG